MLEKIDRLQAEFAAEQQTAVNIDQRIGLIQQYAHPKELTAKMLNALIEKIAAQEKIIGTDGVKEQTVNICCCFAGKIAEYPQTDPFFRERRNALQNANRVYN